MEREERVCRTSSCDKAKIVSHRGVVDQRVRDHIVWLQLDGCWVVVLLRVQLESRSS
jgi:hypothetical protein